METADDRRPVNQMSTTTKMLGMLNDFDMSKPLSKPVPKEVKKYLSAGADPNALAFPYPIGAKDFAAARAVVAQAQTPQACKLPGVQAHFFPLVFRAVGSVDLPLVALLKEHSTVPLNPRGLFVSQGDGPRVALDVLQLAMTQDADRVLQATQLALELGGGPNGVCCKQSGDTWRFLPNVLQLCYGCGDLGPDTAEALLRLLAKHGADLNAVSDQGDTFLGMLLEKLDGYEPLGDELWPVTERLLKAALELGADPDLPSAAPSPPFCTVYQLVRGLTPDIRNEGDENRPIVQRMLRVLQILMDAGANLKPEAGIVSVPATVTVPVSTLERSTVVNNVHTYLVPMVLADCGPLIQWVLDNTGANANIFLDNGTPSYLLHAARSGSPTAARLLLEAGADPTIRDHTGLTAVATSRHMVRASVSENLPDILGPDHAAIVGEIAQASRGRHQETLEVLTGPNWWQARRRGGPSTGLGQDSEPSGEGSGHEGFVWEFAGGVGGKLAPLSWV